MDCREETALIAFLVLLVLLAASRVCAAWRAVDAVALRALERLREEVPTLAPSAPALPPAPAPPPELPPPPPRVEEPTPPPPVSRPIGFRP